MVFDQRIYEKPLPEEVMEDIKETLRLDQIYENAPEEKKDFAAMDYGTQASYMLTSFKIAYMSGQISQADFDELKRRYYVL